MPSFPAPSLHPAIRRYGVALLLSAAAFALTLGLEPFIESTRFVVFFAALAISARYGGLGPGLLTAVIAVAAVDYYLVPPVGTFTPHDPADLVPLIAFAVVAYLISRLTSSLAVARERAEQRARANEELAEQLQLQATELEQQMEEGQALAEELEEANEHLRLATERAQGARDTAVRTAELTRGLQAATARLADALTPSEVARVVVEAATPAIGAAAGAVLLLDMDGAELEVAATSGRASDDMVLGQRLVVESTFASGEAVRTRTPVFLSSPEEWQARFASRAPWGTGYAALASLPLVTAERTYGGLSFAFAEPRTLADDERALLQALAGLGAQALARAHLFEGERAARTEAERASRAKSDFLAVMSHELRTPLNAIIGYEALLEDGVTGPVSDEQRAQLIRIRASARHLLTLIDEVLTLSRVEAGMETVRWERVNVDRVVGEAAEMVAPLAGEKQLALDIRLPPESLSLQTDLAKLRQILTNLLSNAVKFTERGGITLGVQAVDGQVQFEVRDTGIGIAPEHLSRIFDSFWQVEQTATRRVGGSGLGLAVTRRLAHLLGGEIAVESAPGAGSAFRVSLPLSRERPPADAKPSG